MKNIFSQSVFIAMAMISFLLSGCKDDDVIIEQSCGANINIGLQSLDRTSATLSWVETQGFSSNYEYGKKGFMLGEGTRGITLEESISITNLEWGTEYDFYLQSVCSETLEGKWIASPYQFKTIDCTGLTEERVVPIGFIDNNNSFQVQWNPFIGEANEIWEAKMALSTNTGIENENVLTTSERAVVFSDIIPSSKYIISIRKKCGDNFGEWIEKEIITPEKKCILSEFVFGWNDCVNFSGRTEDFMRFQGNQVNKRFYFEFLELDQEIGQGITYSDITNNDNIITIKNECLARLTSTQSARGDEGYWNEEYDNGVRLKPNTEYDFYITFKCEDNSISESKLVTQYKTPECNQSIIKSLQIEGNSVKMDYYTRYVTPITFAFSRYKLDNLWWEIEYGKEGFVNGEGTIINRNPEEDRALLVPLSELESNTIYEFTVRAKCNNISYGEYSEREKITTPN